MEIKKFTVREKEITLYQSHTPDRPLIVLNVYTGNGSEVMKKLQTMQAEDFNLLAVGNLKWNHDMTPWDCPPISKNDTSYTGGADEYLELLLSEILPKARQQINGTPSFIGIAGYSLAGLFSIYALYRCGLFDRAASMSGSLWFPNFRDFMIENKPYRKPDKLYISLGDKEADTRQPLLKTVQDKTEAIAEHFRALGVDVNYEMNEGNHFKDADLRSAKGIRALL